MQRLGIPQGASLYQTWLVRYMRLQYFGNLTRASLREDHHRVVVAPLEWKRRPATF